MLLNSKLVFLLRFLLFLFKYSTIWALYSHNIAWLMVKSLKCSSYTFFTYVTYNATLQTVWLVGTFMCSSDAHNCKIKLITTAKLLFGHCWAIYCHKTKDKSNTYLIKKPKNRFSWGLKLLPSICETEAMHYAVVVVVVLRETPHLRSSGIIRISEFPTGKYDVEGTIMCSQLVNMVNTMFPRSTWHERGKCFRCVVLVVTDVTLGC